MERKLTFNINEQHPGVSANLSDILFNIMFNSINFPPFFLDLTNLQSCKLSEGAAQEHFTPCKLVKSKKIRTMYNSMSNMKKLKLHLYNTLRERFIKD